MGEDGLNKSFFIKYNFDWVSISVIFITMFFFVLAVSLTSAREVSTLFTSSNRISLLNLPENSVRLKKVVELSFNQLSVANQV